MDIETKNEFSAVRTDLQHVDARLTAEVRRVETTLQEKIRDEGIATRRHFDVVSESLRDDIRSSPKASSRETQKSKRSATLDKLRKYTAASLGRPCEFPSVNRLIVCSPLI